MFISVADIKDTTGYDVDFNTVRIAQLMIETWVGKAESEVEDASDIETLGRATLFQAVYINGSVTEIMEQAAVKTVSIGESTTSFDTSRFAPYMSPWAIESCKKLSWMGGRTIKTGRMFQHTAPVVGWEED